MSHLLSFSVASKAFTDKDLRIMETLFIILGILQVFALACIIFWFLGYAAKKYPTYWKSVFPSQSGDPEPKTSFLRHYGKESENKEIEWV